MTLHERLCWNCNSVAMHEDNVTPHVLCKKCGSQDTRALESPCHARQAWEFAREELIRRIEAQIDAKPDGQNNIWYIEESDGDMSEFATMLGVIDMIFESNSLDYEKLR